MAILSTTIQSGKVRGIETAAEGISAFLGIPFARSTAGEMRWRSPEKPEAWEGERLCDDYGKSCWQRDPFAGNRKLPPELEGSPIRRLRMDEDCLSLNVWTPANSTDERLPVMVWFYGGGLQGGTSDDPIFDGETLCSYGVILVTANYRTGVFGYFGHDELEKETEYGTSGNYGLQDQIFALQWVHDNIAAFGGDAGNVTIFGCSGGGRSVQGVSCSPRSVGLVHHAVCHSAGGLNPDYSLPYDDIKALANEFMEFCGKKTIAEMRQIPAPELQEKYGQFRKQFNITGDGYYLPYTMDEMVRRGLQQDIDYILSTMNNEFVMPPQGEITLENFDQWRPKFGLRTSILSNVVHPTTDEEALDVFTNREAYEMKGAQLAWARVQMKQDKKPVRLCTFVHPVPGRNGLACHGDDQFYVFHTLFKFNRPYGAEDEALSRRLMKYWTNFAKTGDPNGEGLDPWPVFTEEDQRTFIIDTNECRLEDRSHPYIEAVVAAYIDNRRS